MLAKGRFVAILSILQKQRTVTVLELTQALSISGSTIRRDLVALHKMGELKKIHSSTALLHKECGLYETEVVAHSEGHVEEKKRIARYATSLIRVHDFVYIDAGNVTLHMVKYLKGKEAIYVTNRLEHGKRLATQGFRTLLLAGELKSKMEAVVGLGTASSLQRYNFGKAFFGISGITVDSGFAAPNTNETYIKIEVMKHAQKCYVLVDSDKFGTCISITAADISDTTVIIGEDVEREYLEEANIIEVEE